MSFAHCSVLETFWDTIIATFPGSMLQFALVYLDYIVIFTKRAKQHMEHTREVLSVLNSIDGVLKQTLRIFFTHTDVFPGHLTPSTRLELTSHTKHGLQSLKSSTNIIWMRPFLGLCTFFRWFVRAQIASPLNHRSKKFQPNAIFPLHREKLNAMESFKAAPKLPPLRALL